MRELPMGTVTLLFTDIEGSTNLLHEFGDRYADVLAEHRRVLRKAFQSHGGVEVDTQGDAFFYAFTSPTEAVTAAAEAQAALAHGPVRVRMGIHTGEPTPTEEGYVGGDVHRAARMMGAGHGGQVLLSSATAALVDVELRDLGAHRLKDLIAAEHIYQLGHAEFPPLQAIDVAALPVATSPLIGREEELSELLSLLRDGQRVVTMTGPGGIGKSRLALQVAAELTGSFSDGVFWVPLAGVEEPELVLPAIGQAVGARGKLTVHLREREALVVLDTVEHLLDASPDLAELLTAAPRLRLLVTSRVPLHISAEYEYPVDPLPRRSAATLFVERARAAGRELELDETVTEICGRLDNLPLALELAAARTKLLDPATLLSRLGRRLPILVGGPRDVPERQQTLEGAIAWSYDLLDEDAQSVFRRLGAFAGGFSLDAAEAVGEADLDVLARLVDASLVKPVGDGRLLMLDTIREYAVARLEEARESAVTRDRHAAYFANLVNSRWLPLIRGDDPEWSLTTVKLEHRNLHAAIEWSFERGQTEHVLAIVGGIWPFWANSGYVQQGKRWLERALEPPSRSPARRAVALGGLGDLANGVGDHEGAKAAHTESLAIFRDLDHAFGIASNLTQLADIALIEGDRATARRLAEESIEIRRKRLGSFHLGRALASLADVSLAEADYDRARALYEDALEHVKAEAPDSNHLIHCYEALGEILRLQTDLRGALEAFAESMRAAQRGSALPLPETLEGIAAIREALGDRERAARLAGAAESIREQLSSVRWRPERSLPERLEPAWSEGRAMSAEEAVEYALRDIE